MSIDVTDDMSVDTRSVDITVDMPIDMSVDTLSSIGRHVGSISTDSPLSDAHGVGRRIDRDAVGDISVNYRLYIGRLSVDTRPSIDMQSFEYRSIYFSTFNLCIDRYTYRTI